MREEKQRSGKFYFKWPWNLAVYIILILLLRIFAIPVILLLMAWNQKRRPDGPEEGYCLQRTRRRLARLVWAALFLIIGLACGTLFVVQATGDKSGWDAMDYVTLAVAGVLGLGGIVGGLYEGYTDLRDAFWPEKSRLAQSIRSQLPYPDEAPGVKELFAMVDRDIQENGQWFDRVAVGRKWVLGDDASAIPRIRAVFGRDEVRHHRHNGRTQTTRIIELYILDDRRQVQITALRDPKELEPLLNCLRLRAPEALFRPYTEYFDYCGKSEEAWQALERDFQRRRAQRDQRAEDQARAAARSNPDFIFTDIQGRRTSRFDRETIRAQLRDLRAQGQRFTLEPVEPIPAGGLGLLVRMECGVTDTGTTLIAVLRQPDGTFRARALPSGAQAALPILTALLEERRLPDLTVWQALQAVSGQSQPAQPQLKLTLTDSTGLTRDYASITRRDVELAGEGLSGGKYSAVLLQAGPQYLSLQAGTREDGRVTVNAGRPGPDGPRVFETKCTDRQARVWLLDLADGQFDPGFSHWKDITRQLQEQARKKASKQ